MQKKNITKAILLIFFITNSLASFSQGDEKTVVDERTTKAIKDIKERMDDMEASLKNLRSSLSNNKADQEELKKNLGKVVKNGDNTKTTIVLNKKNLILNASNFTGKALVTLNGFNASMTTTELSTQIVSLNNPTNQELGFSLEGAIQSQVKELMKDKVKGDEATKINGFIGQLLNNPITEILKTSVPVINNVVNFITALSFNNKKISADDLKNFLTSLSGYFKYYENLSENNQEFASSLNEIRVKLAALEMLTKNYIAEKSTILYGSNIETSIQNLEVNKLYKEYFNPDKIAAQISIIEKDQTNTAQDDDSRLKFPTTTSSQAQYLYGEFESLSSQYINAYKKYVGRIKQTLDLGKNLTGATSQPKSDIETRIKEKQKHFDDLLEVWEKTFTNSINLYDLRKAAQNLATIAM